MKFPRTSIAGLMTLVLFVAANCAILRGVMALQTVWREVLILGFLPMANLLAIGLLPWLRRRPARAEFGGFRAGFVVCGGLASATFLILSLRFTDDLFQLPQAFFEPYVHPRPGLGLLSSALLIFVGPQLAFAGLGLLSSALLIFVGPQLAFAGLGGWLGRWMSRNADRHDLKVPHLADSRTTERSPSGYGRI